MMGMQPELMKIFGFWGSILVLKMLAMVPLIARYRFSKKIFANPEDTTFVGKKGKVVYDDPDVERVRRSHLNDLENILPWFIITYIWLGTGPSAVLASILIRTFVLCRIIHTLVYAVYPQQPMRAISFFVAFGIIGFEAVATLVHYM